MPSQPAVARKSPSRRNLWFERCIAIVAMANLGLVLFDLSYVSWRNFWLQGTIAIPLTGTTIQLPVWQVACPDSSVKSGDPPRYVQQSAITCLYDPIKGIEPHRDTRRYLEVVEQLEQQVKQKGFSAPEVQQSLETLRTLSSDMIETNPFAIANKSGTLEKIKNRMRDHIYGDQRDRLKKSSREAFKTFWSTENLASQWNQEDQWFNQQIKPLMSTNYYRTISESGDLTNNVGVLDTPFAILFVLEFAARTFYISRRYASLNWLDAMLWRWYDILLFFPFWLFFPPLALLRVIPVTIRLHQSQLVDMNRVRDQASQQFVGSIANELTEVVVVQVIDQVQAVIRQGEITRWLTNAVTQPRVEVNDTDEVAAISTILLKLLVYETLPKIQTDLAALLHHGVEQVLQPLPAYRALKNLPGLTDLPLQLTERLVTEVIQIIQSSFTAVLQDQVGAELSARLVKNLGQAVSSEVQEREVLPEIQGLLNDLLEEVKLGFVKRTAEMEKDLLSEETRQLRRMKGAE